MCLFDTAHFEFLIEIFKNFGNVPCLTLHRKILQIRGFLGKNLGKILTKKSRNIQDSHQELQEFLHWEEAKKTFGYFETILFSFAMFQPLFVKLIVSRVK